MSYVRTNWRDLPRTETPITAEKLNNIEEGIMDAGIYVSKEEPTEYNRRKAWLQKGKNKFNAYAYSYYTRSASETYEINSANSIKVTGTNYSLSRVQIIVNNLKANAQYTVSSYVTNTSAHIAGIVAKVGNVENESTSQSTSFKSEVSFTTDNNGRVELYLYSNYSNSNLTEIVTFNDIQIELGASSSQFEYYIRPQIYVKNINEQYEPFMWANFSNDSTGPIITNTEIELQERISANEQDIEVLQQQVSELEENNTNLRNAMLEVSGEGYNVALNETSKNKFNKISIRGNIQQGENPSPASPQAINTVTGNVNIKISNKNILPTEFNKYITTRTYGYIKLTNIEEDLTLSVTDKDTSIDMSGIYFGFSGSGYDYSSGTKWIVSDGAKVATSINNQYNVNTQKLKFFSFFPDNLTTFNKIMNRFNVQIEENIVATSFIEHEEQNYPLSLGSIELSQIGTYIDYIVKTNSKWYKHQWIAKDIISITSTAKLSNDNIVGVHNTTNTKLPTTGNTILASNAIAALNYLEGTCYQNIRNVCFVGNTTDTLATLKTKYNGGELYYIKESPVDIEITDTTLIQQLNELEKALSYKGVTVINGTSSENPPFLVVSAVADINTAFKILQSRVDLLEG